MVRWQWASYNDLSLYEFDQIMQVRQAVFVVEQHCAYQDADGLDQHSWHLIGWQQSTNETKIIAYLRVVFPGIKYPEAAIGRLLTTLDIRGEGLGKELLRQAIGRIAKHYPHTAIRISAQQHLQRFYSEFGFETVSKPYDEDGIPHIEMLKP